MTRPTASRTLAALVTASLALIAAPAAGAHAAAPSHRSLPRDVPFTLENQDSGECLAADEDGSVGTMDCSTDNPWQIWTYDAMGDLVNTQTKTCISNEGDGEVKMSEYCGDGVTMEWKYDKTRQSLCNKFDDRCLAENYGEVYTTYYGGYPNERWTVHKL